MKFLLWLLISVNIGVIRGRIHHLSVRDDPRRFFPISTFGFYQGGSLSVNLTHFRSESRTKEDIFGFSIDKTFSGALNPYLETSEGLCILNPKRNLPKEEASGILRFILDFEKGVTLVKCSDNIRSIQILKDNEELAQLIAKREGGGRLSDSGLFQKTKKKTKKKRDVIVNNSTTVISTTTTKSKLDRISSSSSSGCENVQLKLSKGHDEQGDYYNTTFVIYIHSEKEEGLYSLYFHNCHNYDYRAAKTKVGFSVKVEERNNDSYLSAGEMPLPALYILMAVLFFLSGCFWVFILRKNGSEQVYRIHWIMAALVYLKSLSLFFHGINFHKIETNGVHIESWAILYYITHLLKGGLLFFTIVLIGSGWAFIKHILSDKEKRVFMMVLPLQILANVAYIIVEESEEGEDIHTYYKNLFIMVDLLCCGAILLPVVWSIRHLQDSSGTDGKATISLEKLKLFRHFYIMVVCYIYFTRIIVYLLRITVPFQYEWLDEMFTEMATFVFFVMTGYKFRPASNNPYFSVPTDDYEIEEVLIGNTAINEQVVNRNKNSSTSLGNSVSNRVFLDDDDESDDDEGMVFFPSSQNEETTRRHESSHDLD